MASLAEPSEFSVWASEVTRMRKLVMHWQRRAYQREQQRNLWKHRYEEERRVRIAVERTLAELGREAA